LPDDARRRRVAVVISHDFWQRTFAASEEVIGQTVGIDGHKKTIVGVLPPNFSVFPWKMTVDAWLAFNFDRREPSMRWMDVVARLTGVSFESSNRVSAIALQTQRNNLRSELWRIQIEPSRSNVANTKGFSSSCWAQLGLYCSLRQHCQPYLGPGAAVGRNDHSCVAGCKQAASAFQALRRACSWLLGHAGLFLAIWGQKIVLLLNLSGSRSVGS
jgi:hypothetical protein